MSKNRQLISRKPKSLFPAATTKKGGVNGYFDPHPPPRGVCRGDGMGKAQYIGVHTGIVCGDMWRCAECRKCRNAQARINNSQPIKPSPFTLIRGTSSGCSHCIDSNFCHWSCAFRVKNLKPLKPEGNCASESGGINANISGLSQLSTRELGLILPFTVRCLSTELLIGISRCSYYVFVNFISVHLFFYVQQGRIYNHWWLFESHIGLLVATRFGSCGVGRRRHSPADLFSGFSYIYQVFTFPSEQNRNQQFYIKHWENSNPQQ
jgi:hypothetical protein